MLRRDDAAEDRDKENGPKAKGGMARAWGEMGGRREPQNPFHPTHQRQKTYPIDAPSCPVHDHDSAIAATRGWVMEGVTLGWRDRDASSQPGEKCIMKSQLAVFAIVAFHAAPAAAEVISNETNDITGTIFQECIGEEVDLEGTIHTIIRTTVDANGGMHVGVRARIKAQGTGATTGGKYVVSLQNVMKENVTGAGAMTQVLEVDSHIIGQGKSPNFVAVVRVHMTVNANGVVTVDSVEVSSRCR